MRFTRHCIRVAAAALAAALATGGALALGTASTAGAATTVTTPVATTTKVVSSRPTANYGSGGAITATVKSVTAGAGVATGTVDFSVDGNWYWSAPLDAVGKAKWTLADFSPSFTPGTYQVTASYSGDATHDPSTSAAISQTLVGISTQPVTTITVNGRGLPVFSPRSFTMSSLNPVGCNVTIFNNTTSTLALAYGTPGNWKRLPSSGGIIGPGQSRGIGVSLANFTGYFTTTANLANYVTIHCR